MQARLATSSSANDAEGLALGEDEGPSLGRAEKLESAASLDLIREEVIDEHALERQSVTVRVPASSANMGPGYDCLGMALNIWSEVTVERSDHFEIVYEGEGADAVPKDASNLLVTGVKAAFKAAGKDLPLLRYHCVNRIPYARGMGSSSAAIVAGIIAGLVLAGHRLPCWGSEALLQLACSIEGHPDNVAPVIYGGCQLGIHNGERWQTERVHLPSGIQVVLFIPDFEGKTSDARGVLEDHISRDEAVFSIGRVAWLINALVTGNLDNLRSGCQDALHQPQRARSVYPYLDSVCASALAAGACAAYLSGAGPTVAAITSGASGDIFTQRAAERVDKDVASAMVQAAAQCGVQGKVYITQPIETGAVVVSATPEFSQGCIRYQGDI
jgi:homoserine kinase